MAMTKKAINRLCARFFKSRPSKYYVPVCHFNIVGYGWIGCKYVISITVEVYKINYNFTKNTEILVIQLQEKNTILFGGEEKLNVDNNNMITLKIG